MMFLKRKKDTGGSIEFDEVFLDGENLPNFNTYQFEGRIEKPIGKHAVAGLGGFFALVLLVFGWQVGELQIAQGESFFRKSENNRLDRAPVFSERGVIYDRNGVELAWNTPGEEGFADRSYANIPGIAHVVGYVSYPAKDKKGIFYQYEFSGKTGVEELHNTALNGKNGERIIETDAHGVVQSESILEPARPGANIHLAIDSGVSSKLFLLIEELVNTKGFTGGAGIIMDVQTGELITMASFPEYDSAVLSHGDDGMAVKKYVHDPRNPFLNRATAGLYTPGSIIKPFVALAALSYGVISPEKEILSTGSITVRNPYNPELSSVFTDWKAHGLVDMRRALAVSSNVYFYEIGGGFGSQKGIGIERLEEFVRRFGIGEKTGLDMRGESEGIIPNPAWKEKIFDGEPWRIGDTYNTSIGQYGFQVTPIQMVRAIGAIGNGGVLVTPSIMKGGVGISEQIPGITRADLAVVTEGMRQGVLSGTAKGLDIPGVAVAAKTGTAEVGISKKRVNSWVVGFFPYEKPRYAFTVVMEKGPRENTIGGVFVMRQLLEWMSVEKPEYFKE